MQTDINPRYKCFLSIPNAPEFKLVREASKRGAEEAGFKILSRDKPTNRLGYTNLEVPFGELAQADCLIADVSDQNPNVYFEMGLAEAMGKWVILLTNKHSVNSISSHFSDHPIIGYDYGPNALSDLMNQVKKALSIFRQSPYRSPTHRPYTRPFFIDWDRLEISESENICRELLSQMGFQRLEWGKITPEIDLVAQLPRKDPDGFEYRELWMISMGLHAPIEIFLDMALGDPEFFFHRILKYSETFEKFLTRGIETPFTFLVILFRENREYGEIDKLLDRLERRKSKNKSSGFNIRFRIWDQAYLTSLIHQFPQIAYKYFSDESRIRSKTRKSYEDLYGENFDLIARQAKLINELEEEKNKRVRAERDSIWKDISFSAAHKIGNPIFAIETDLDPLLLRLLENRTPEAIDVIENIRSSVEKAKAFVEQFKSLARAQEIKPVPTLLLPILEDARRSVCNSEINCHIECPSDLIVWADPDRISECLDELLANAKHWFDKPDKTINLKVVFPIPEPIPSFLDSNEKYFLLHVKDNGCGIETANKKRIFDAFFTTYDHGTGLGLALVRRIIDGHGGGIVESGVPGQGADFEIYLPLPPEVKSKKVLLNRIPKKI